MKKSKKYLSVVLAFMIAFSFSFQSFAADDVTAGEPYSAWAHIVDNLLGKAHDAIFEVLMKISPQKNIPSFEEYNAQEHETFFEGTDGEVTGTSWSGGFAKRSIIPTKWRCDANGKSNPNGSCLKFIHSTGGYTTFVSKLYTDQMMNMEIFTCRTDENHNGVNDILIFISVDGVGITAGTCDKIRVSILESLAEYGVTADDILGCNVSATHCHSGLDIQGMNIFTVFLNKLNPRTDNIRSLNEDMENSICEQAKSCAKEAYSKIEEGSLYFFETDEIDGCSDKLNCGAKTKNTFSCFLFESNSGKKTILTNIGAHPAGYDATLNNMLCTDYPYFMALALNDAGYNLVFTQSCQASVTSPNVSTEYAQLNESEANEWIKTLSLTKENWLMEYGKIYTETMFDSLENNIEDYMRKGYLLAHFIIDSIDKSDSIKPSLNIKNTQQLLSLEYGIMAWGSTSGLLGENVVATDKSETGYGVMVEMDYIEFGNEVIILTAPGELSPALVYGTDPNYTGTTLWTGTTSWTGEDWKYDTLKNIVCSKAESADKKFVFLGITNDALGYIYPDICTPKSLLGTLIFYKDSPKHPMVNDMLMTVGTSCGHELMDGYISIINSIS